MQQHHHLPWFVSFLLRTCPLWLAVVTTGCVTLGRHKLMEDRVLALERFERETKELLQRDVTRLENLNTRLQEATEELRLSGAGIGARIGGIEEDQRHLTGKLEEVEHLARLLEVQVGLLRGFVDERFAVSLTPLPTDTPKEPLPMLEYAERALKAGQHEKARVVLQHFIKHHNSHEKAPTAQLMLGETYRLQRRYRQALKQYFEVYEPYARTPASRAPPEVPQALWLAAKTLQESGACRKAVEMLKLLQRSYRGSPEALQAKELLPTVSCE